LKGRGLKGKGSKENGADPQNGLVQNMGYSIRNGTKKTKRASIGNQDIGKRTPVSQGACKNTKAKGTLYKTKPVNEVSL